MYKDKLVELRENIELKQKELAKIINLDNTCYNHYETEYNIIPLKYLNDICEFFNVSLDYIFSFTDIKQYENSRKEINTKLSGRRLKEFRKENKLTQVKLAQLLNTCHQTFTNYERGIYIIATPFLYTICKKYSISADYLLGKTNEPKSF